MELKASSEPVLLSRYNGSEVPLTGQNRCQTTCPAFSAEEEQTGDGTHHFQSVLLDILGEAQAKAWSFTTVSEEGISSEMRHWGNVSLSKLHLNVK